MPHKIVIDGVIGFDVTPDDIRAELESANGKDIQVEINSPGGNIRQGAVIFNLFKAYAGGKTVFINSLAASMASYIALAFDSVEVADNSMYMIHNGRTLAIGESSELRKEADKLDRLTAILSREYIRKTGKSSKEVASLMNDETWFFGSEIVEAGFADKLIESSEGEAKEDALEFAKLQIDECSARMKKAEVEDDLDKAAALLDGEAPAKKKEQTTPAPKAQTETTKENMPVDLKDPEVVKAIAEAVAEAEAKLEPKEDPTPKVDASAFAEGILKGEGYPESVRAMALKVIKGEQTTENLEAVVAMSDMQTEAIKAAEAAKETGDLGETPGEQPKEVSKNEVAAAETKAFLAKANGGN